MEVLKLLLVVQPLLGALGPQLARPRALDLDDLLGGGVLGKTALISEHNFMVYPSFQYVLQTLGPLCQLPLQLDSTHQIFHFMMGHP